MSDIAQIVYCRFIPSSNDVSTASYVTDLLLCVCIHMCVCDVTHPIEETEDQVVLVCDLFEKQVLDLEGGCPHCD